MSSRRSLTFIALDQPEKELSVRSASQTESVTLTQSWRNRFAGMATLAKSRGAQNFAVNLAVTMAVHAAGVIIEKLIVVPYLARNLSESTFGAVLLGRNATVILSGGLYAGVYNLLLRHNQDWEGAEKALAVRSAAFLSLIISLAIVALTIITLGVHSGAALIEQQALPIFAFAIWGISTTVAYVLQTYWRMWFRIKLQNMLQLIVGLGLLAVVPMHRWLGSSGIYWGFAIGGLVPLLITLVYCYRDMRGQNGSVISAGQIREMARRMWVFIWGNFCQSLLQNTDRFVIGYLISASAVGWYFKATSAAYMIIVPVEPLSGLIMSMIAQEKMGKNTLKLLRLLHLLMLTLIIGLLFIGLLLGKPITNWLYGAGTFEAGKSLYLIILAGCSVAVIPILLRGMTVVHSPTRWILWQDSISVILLAALCFILTSYYGLTGAAVAVALSMLLRAMISEVGIWLAIRRHPAFSEVNNE